MEVQDTAARELYVYLGGVGFVRRRVWPRFVGLGDRGLKT